MIRDETSLLLRQSLLANAIFPFYSHFSAAPTSRIGCPWDRDAIEETLTFNERPVRLRGTDKQGFADVLHAAEINQNIFVHAAIEAGLPLFDLDDVRHGTGVNGHDDPRVEARVQLGRPRGILPTCRTAEEGREDSRDARIRTTSRFTIPLGTWSATRGGSLARDVFETNRTVSWKRSWCDRPAETIVIVTSDHGHLEQVAILALAPQSDFQPGTSGRTPKPTLLGCGGRRDLPCDRGARPSTGILSHQLAELLERGSWNRAGRRRLWMVLQLNIAASVRIPSSAIVQIMCVAASHRKEALPDRPCSVVLRGDLNLARDIVEHRLVAPRWPNFNLTLPPSATEQLMPQADAENRLLAEQPLHGCRWRSRQQRVAGAMWKERCVRLVGQHLVGGRRARHHGYLAATCVSSGGCSTHP